MRGEHVCVDEYDGNYTGSSPHARGAHPPPLDRAGRHGIIPACAGSTVIYLQAYQMSRSNLFTFFDRCGVPCPPSA